MAVKEDPGSYAVHDEPFDTYSATYVPLRTPHGPITLVVIGNGAADVRSGYVTSEYSRGEVTRTEDVPGFTVDNITVGGSASFTFDGTPRNDAHLYGKGGSITPRREKFVLAYWAEIVRRYAAEHAHIPAHAQFRASVAAMREQDETIRKAEEELAAMRRERAKMRREVRRAFIVDYMMSERGAMDAPRTYHDDSTYTSGYVIELQNDAEFMRSLDALRATNGQEK